MAKSSFTYRAFISYAHADRAWAVWLHRALERYRVPRRLSGAENLRRLGKVFRDEEELAAAAELGPKIDAALKASDVLILVCSPRSAKSKWVNQEIEAFKRLGREHRVFALIVDGTPHGLEDECFPPSLKVTAAGGVAEPLAVDVRKFGRDDAAVRLIAGMLDVGYDDLRQREVRRRRVERRQAQAILITGLLLTIGALTGGYFAARNYVEASEMKSNLFAREAQTLNDEEQYAKAMLMSLYGDPAAQAGWVEQALRPEGFSASRGALARGYTHNRLLTTFSGHTGRVNSVAFSPDGKTVLTGSDDGTAKLWPVEDVDAQMTFAEQNGQVLSLALSPDGKTILTGSGDATAKLWPIGGGAALATFTGHEGIITSVAFSPDGKMVLTGSFDRTAKLWSTNGGAALTTLPDTRKKSIRLPSLPMARRC